jgi:hypothetical protein
MLPQARFVPDKFGLYVVQLVVNDGQAASDPDTARRDDLPVAGPIPSVP